MNCRHCGVEMQPLPRALKDGLCASCRKQKEWIAFFESRVAEVGAPPVFSGSSWEMPDLRPPVSVWPLGTYALLPAICLGFDITDQGFSRFGQLTEVPSWLWYLEQQAGGYSMSYPDFLGFVFRLSDNEHLAKHPLEPLIRSFWAAAEDPDCVYLERYQPDLAPLIWTDGRNYTDSECRALGRLMEQYLPVPGIESGIEAWVTFEASDPLETFEGWSFLELAIAAPPEPVGSSVIVVGENLSDVTAFSRSKLSHELVEQLVQIGSELGIAKPLRSFLLWENSD